MDTPRRASTETVQLCSKSMPNLVWLSGTSFDVAAVTVVSEPMLLCLKYGHCML